MSDHGGIGPSNSDWQGNAYIFMQVTEFKTLTQVVQGRRDESDDEEAPSGSTPVLSSTPAGISGPDAQASESDPQCSVPSAAATEVHKPRHKVGTTIPYLSLLCSADMQDAHSERLESRAISRTWIRQWIPSCWCLVGYVLP